MTIAVELALPWDNLTIIVCRCNCQRPGANRLALAIIHAQGIASIARTGPGHLFGLSGSHNACTLIAQSSVNGSFSFITQFHCSARLCHKLGEPFEEINSMISTSLKLVWN